MAERRAARWLVLACAVVLAGCDVSLRSGLDERQADEILASLRQEGVPARRERTADGTWALLTAKGNVADAERIMHRYELPKDSHPRVPELFPGTGLMPSELEEHLRYQYAVGQELSTTIERIDGVLSASVQVAIPREEKGRAEKARPSASVFVRYRSDQRVDLMKAQLRDMVAHAVPSAVADDIVVFALPVAPALSERAMAELGSELSKASGASSWRSAVTALPWALLALAVALWMARRSGRARLHGYWKSLRKAASTALERPPGSRRGGPRR